MFFMLSSYLLNSLKFESGFNVKELLVFVKVAETFLSGLPFLVSTMLSKFNVLWFMFSLKVTVIFVFKFISAALCPGVELIMLGGVVSGVGAGGVGAI